jgi:hypothetical protein
VSHSYRAYGLSILSEILIPGLIALPTRAFTPDLKLELGPEPAWVSDALQLRSRCFHKQTAEPATHDPALIVSVLGEMEFFELAYSDGMRFVLDGSTSRIWAQWSAPLTTEDFATYFLGPVMGFVLRRRGVIALHASSVRVEGHAIAFSGEAHAGKSTTAAAMALRGASVLCEDIAALREKSGALWVDPGYPRVCLWPDSVEKLVGAADALPRLTPTWEKRYLPLDGSLATFETQSRPLAAVYLFAPRVEDGNAPRLEDIGPRDAVLELVQNTYMNWILDRAQRAAEFDVLARMAARVPIRRVVAHRDPRRIPNLCDLLFADAARLAAEGITAQDVSGQ